ncbi:uncharacterized protein Z518_05841 [Rhinocladiella mackenziei CBS 650.93]|uniref:Immune-responsive protein n=1 Tax=Rhinocladiella mackenziei CBS 650.93 TaxID=1442369 RepID=A0A0D2IGU4_9EURO|nr:uncharacterized protein Z518_05841 [Rhinocladiella mackenziei CBS 650.93]KIX04969.1 hypothetical protein Z518_05841 [Rhinocladiella mackenziei CBS 650.93]
MGSISSKDSHKALQPTDPKGPTGKLANWIHEVTLDEVPHDVKTRAKYLLLDGLACLLVGAHLPGSEVAAHAIFDMEAPGNCTVYGWGGQKLGPLQAALLNSTFIQGFELDDWHSEAPLHSNSLVLPAMLAAVEHDRSIGLLSSGRKAVTGLELLLATIVGYEVGPRVGLGLHGAHVLTVGWHSGAVFGPSAAAAASSKLLGLSPNQIEDALGIACTQAGGLMSAQYESEVKRMQHGFATRNGLLGTLLARNGYTGIKRVYEQKYGGFLTCFSRGNGMVPECIPDEVSRELGTTWKTEGIRAKAYSSMAGTHCTVDCLRDLQEKYPSHMSDFKRIKHIQIEMGEASFHHGGWEATRPLTVTGAQMNNAYVGATQLIDKTVLPTQFRNDKLDRDEIWELVSKTTCHLSHEFKQRFAQRVTVEFVDGNKLAAVRDGPRGVSPELSNQDILEKWRMLTQAVIDDARREKIERLVLKLECCEDVLDLVELLTPASKNPLT